MKKYFLILLILPAIIVQAQKSHFGLSMGLAKPLNDFAGTSDYYNQGYAQPGFNLSFSGNYVPYWYFGIGGALSFATNYPAQDKMKSDIIKVLDLLEQPNVPTTATVNLEFDNWSYVNLLVGPTIAIPAGPMQFNIKTFMGMSVVFPPSQNLEIEFDNQRYTNTNEPQSLSFCYNVGLDIIYKLHRNYSLLLGTEYFRTKTSPRSNFKYIDSNDQVIDLPVNDKTVTIEALHFTLGMAYLF